MIDTAPHHVHYEIENGKEMTVSRHFACCADLGCLTCKEILEA